MDSPETLQVVYPFIYEGEIMKKVLCAVAGIVYLAGASAAFAAPEEVGSAAGATAGTLSAGTSTAVGVGAAGALVGVVLAASSGGNGSNTGTTTTTTTSTTR